MALGKLPVMSIPPGERRWSRPSRQLPSGLATGLPDREVVLPPGHTAISMLPDFLCSRLTGTLAEIEAVAVAAEAAPSQEAASEAVRPDVELPGASAATPAGPPRPRRPRSGRRPIFP